MMYFFLNSTSAGPQQMCPVMSWLLCLCLWVSVTAIQLCQATFYDTIQQHHGTRPGRTTIHMIGESFLRQRPPPARAATDLLKASKTRGKCFSLSVTLSVALEYWHCGMLGLVAHVFN